MITVRKVLAVLLVLSMTAGIAVWPGNAKNAQAEVFGNYTYLQLSDAAVKITKYNGPETKVEIPAKIDGKSVTSIGQGAFQDKYMLEEVSIPPGVTVLEPQAFANCTGLKKAMLAPSSLAQIGINAFYGCENLTEVTLPEGLMVIEQNAFGDCASLEGITIPSTVKEVGANAFSGCGKISSIALPQGVAQIMRNTFANCVGLSEVELPSGLTSIGELAFYGCTSLTKIHIPDSVTDMERFIFERCENLTNVTLPSNLKRIKEGMFQRCTNLADIQIPDGVAAIEKDAFKDCSGLEQVRIPGSLTEIGNAAFSGCSSLKEIYHYGTKAQWEQIQMDAAWGSLDLQKINIRHLGDPVDDPLEHFTFEVLQDGTIEITKCISSDEIIKIPEQINGTTVTSIHSSAFINGWDWREITIPSGITNIGDNNFGACSKLEAIHVAEGNADFKSVDGVLFNKDQTRLIKYPEAKDGAYNIPSGVERIESHAFSDCFKLTDVVIPSSVTSIGYGAFSLCSKLTKIKIPASVTSMEGSAFNYCESLTEAEILSDITSIPYCCFYNAKNLKTITIPASVASVADAAFFKCESLTDVYFGGNLDQWEKIKIGTGGVTGVDSSINTNAPLVNAVIHFKDGTTLNGPAEEFSYTGLDDGTIQITKYNGSDSAVLIPEQLDGRKVTAIGSEAFDKNEKVTEVSIPNGITQIGQSAFRDCTNLISIHIPNSVTVMEPYAFSGCENLAEIKLPDRLDQISTGTFYNCKALKEAAIPESVNKIFENAFYGCSSFQDIYYAGTKKQWGQVGIRADGNAVLFSAEIHCKEEPPQDNTEEVVLPVTLDVKQELERLKSGDPFSLEADFKHYLSAEQIDILESYLCTWLGEINCTYQYDGADGVKERIRKKSGIDPQGDFASGTEQAVIHIVAETTYGTKTIEVTLDLGAPDSSGRLYPSYGAMHYEILEKSGLPSDLPVSGQIGRDSYTDLGPFADSVKKASEDSLHTTFQWQYLDDEMTAGVLVDKTVTEIIGNKNGSFSDATFTIYAKPLLKYSKKVTIACPVDVFVYGMDGEEAGSIVNNHPKEENQNVRLDVNGDTKSVYLTGNDYYLNLRGTDTGTMKYEVEEIANEEVRRNVQFLELQLKKDMQYEGYVFRPLNIDRDLYALRTVDGTSKEVIYADTDSYQATFKRVQQMSLSQQNGSLDEKSTVQLNASLLPLDASNQNLNWTTDNASVVSVDSSGLVTAVGAGRATVTVSTKDGSFLKQYCIFDVADQSSKPGDDSNQQPGGDNPGSNGGSSGDVPGNSGDGTGNAPGSTGGSTGGSGSSPGNSGSAGSSPGSFVPPAEQPGKPIVINLHYMIQFDTNGGTNLSRRTMTLLSGDSPGIMPKVQRKDYIFGGWYTQKEGGTQVTGDKPLEEAATLYARWIKASVPAKTASLTLVSKKKGQAQASFLKVTGADGYQIEYAASKDFASAKKKQAGANVNTKTLTGLKAGKKYYIRVRAYVLDSMGNKIYGAYSSVKSIRIKA